MPDLVRVAAVGDVHCTKTSEGTLQPLFAEMAARHHAAPLVQIDPSHISLTAIAAGQYDPYLRSYAAAVRAFGGRVIISFGHEMNGNWYSWAYRHTSPAAFVAAWRHIVTVFRQQGTRNVTWLWAVNVIDTPQGPGTQNMSNTGRPIPVVETGARPVGELLG